MSIGNSGVGPHNSKRQLSISGIHKIRWFKKTLKGGEVMKKMEKKSHSLFLVILSLTVLLSLSCINETNAQVSTKLRLFTGMTPSHYFCTDMLPFFAKEIEKRTAGKVKVEIYAGGQLFSYIEGIDAAKVGAVEIGLTSAGHWGGYSPIFKFSDYFLLIDSYDHWLKARDSIHPILQTLYEKQNVKLLSYAAYGGNSICSRVPIKSLGDLKGLKIRAPVPGAFPCISAWGATPAKVDPGEVFDTLSKGAIDAAITSWSFMYAGKLYEATKHFVGPIWWTVWVNFMNLDTWNRLPKDIQKIILDVSKETEDRSLGWMKNYEDVSLAKLKEIGTVKILTNQELKEWGKPLKPVYEAWVKECTEKKFGKEAKQILDFLDKVR